MCGLAGILSYGKSSQPIDIDDLSSMQSSLYSRGPDGGGSWISDNGLIGLTHRRLAIIDTTAAGAQPMSSPNGRYHIIFNGEIYNYKELRAELILKGVRFTGLSDTEVILQLYIHYSETMCRKLRGMYAFSIWDNYSKTLFLARDPFGIKPLYIYDNGENFRFASQVKSLLAGRGVERELDPAGLVGYHLWGYVPEPFSIFKSIRSLEPGTWLRIDDDGLRECGEFDSLSQIMSTQNEDESLYSDLESAVRNSVESHLVSDVDVGVFLSAGIDSSVLVGMASQLSPKLKTMTLAFEEYAGSSQDESILAEKIARQFRADHKTVWIGQKDFEGLSRHYFSSMDQPSIDGLNTWLISRVASDLGIKAVLSGIGGDEFFGGYPSFRDIPRLRAIANIFYLNKFFARFFREKTESIFSKFTSIKYAGVLEYGNSWEGSYLLRRAMYMPWEISRVINGTVYQGAEIIEEGLAALEESFETNLNRFLKKQQNISPHKIISFLESSHYMRSCLLRDSDWASMAHSVEIRTPFIDKELVGFLSHKMDTKFRYTKKDLASLESIHLPAAVRNRPKSGFSVPVKNWLMTSNSGYSQPGLKGWSKFCFEQYLESLK